MREGALRTFADHNDRGRARGSCVRAAVARTPPAALVSVRRWADSDRGKDVLCCGLGLQPVSLTRA